MILPLSLLCRKKNAHMLLFQYFNMNNKQSGNLPRASGEEGIKYIRVSDIAIYTGNPQYYFLYTIFFLCVISFDTLTLIRKQNKRYNVPEHLTGPGKGTVRFRLTTLPKRSSANNSLDSSSPDALSAMT